MRFRLREVTLNANWVRSSGSGGKLRVQPVPCGPALNAIQSAGFTGGPPLDEGS
jgi:hypothetical protein